MKTYKIQDREAGNVIESGLTYQEAIDTLEKYEKSDKEEGIFTPNFYEIIEVKTGFFIYDNTSNSGKHFINNDSNKNQESTENALAFDTNEKADKYIKDCKLTWASVVEEEYTDRRAIR